MEKGRPSYAYGERLMKQMGWREGKGLGRNEDGNANFIRMKKKLNTKGIGFNGVDDRWVEHQEAFDSLLSQLNDGSPAALESKLIGVEERAFKLGGRVHYSKFLRGKDLSQKKQEELNAIVVKRKKKKDEESVPEVEVKEENLSGVRTHTSSLSYQEYFTQRMEAKKHQIGSSKNENQETSQHTGNDVWITEEEGTEAASQDVEPPDACTHFSSLYDQEGSKLRRKKMKQKSVHSTYETSSLVSTIVANGQLDEATTLAAEEMDSAPRKTKKSKRKSPYSPTRMADDDTEQFEETSVDQEHSKQGRKKMKVKSVQSTCEERLPGGVTVSGHVGEENILTLEELDSASRKRKNSKRKSPDSPTRVEDAEIELFKETSVVKKQKASRNDPVNSIKFERSEATMNEQSSEVRNLSCEELKCTVQQQLKKKAKKVFCGDSAETDQLKEKAVEKKVKKKQKVPRDASEVTRDTKFTGQCLGKPAIFEQLESAAQLPRKSKSFSIDGQAKEDGQEEKPGRQKWIRSEAEKVSEMVTEECSEHDVPEKSKHKKRKDKEGSKRTNSKNQQEKAELEVKTDVESKQKWKNVLATVPDAELLKQGDKKLKIKREKGTEMDSIEQDQPVEYELEAACLEVKARDDSKQKQKNALSCIFNVELLKQGDKKLKIKREKGTEMDSTERDQPMECELEAACLEGKARDDSKQKRKNAISCVSDVELLKQGDKKLKIKREKGTEMDSTERDQPMKCELEAACLEGKARDDSKQKRKNAVSCVSDVELLKQGDKTLKIKREKGTEMDSTEQDQPVECALEAACFEVRAKDDSKQKRKNAVSYVSDVELLEQGDKKLKIKREKGTELDSTERDQPMECELEAACLEVKAKDDSKQKRKNAVSYVSDVELLEQGDKKLKIKREKRTEMDSTEQDRPVECALEAACLEVKARDASKQKRKNTVSCVSDVELLKQGNKKLKIKREKGTEMDSTERDQPMECELEAACLEVKAKDDSKQKRKNAVSYVSDVELLEQGDKKLKIKREKRTEMDSTEQDQPVECALEAACLEVKARDASKQKRKNTVSCVSDVELLKQGDKKLKIKREKGTEMDSTERDQPMECELEAACLEGKARDDSKQKRKNAVSCVSDVELLKQGDKKLKIKREKGTEMNSTEQDQTVECAPEATQSAFLPGCKSTTKQMGSAESQEVASNRKPLRTKEKSRSGERVSAKDVAACKEEVGLQRLPVGLRQWPVGLQQLPVRPRQWPVGLQRWHVGHSFQHPYKMPPITYETAAAMSCWVLDTVEKTATKITPNKACYLSKDEYAELLGNHIFKRHRTSNWLQIPGYSSELWLSKCVSFLASNLRKKAQLEEEARRKR